MKYIALLVTIILLTGCYTVNNEPDQNMRVRIDFSADSREWELNQVQMTPEGYYIDYVLADNRPSDAETVSYRIVYSGESIHNHVAEFEQKSLKADDGVLIEKIVNDDGSITVNYSSKKTGYVGVLRFFQGVDGVHILSYDVKMGHVDEANFRLWSGIVANAKLVPKPGI